MWKPVKAARRQSSSTPRNRRGCESDVSCARLPEAAMFSKRYQDGQLDAQTSQLNFVFLIWPGFVVRSLHELVDLDACFV